MLHEKILLVRDENAFGTVHNEFKLSFEQLEVTVRDIITQRVYLEVEKYNDKAMTYDHALVKPKNEEVILNRSKNKQRKKVDPEKQVEVALKAFTSNGFFMLINDKQVESLDDSVIIEADMIVSFIKLTPLVGG